MKQKDPDQFPKPGIPEALDPSLGNGSLAEKDLHAFLLRTVDPLLLLDKMVLDESTLKENLYRWDHPEQISMIKNSVANENEKVLIQDAPKYVKGVTEELEPLRSDGYEIAISVQDAILHMIEMKKSTTDESSYISMNPKKDADENDDPKFGKRILKIVSSTNEDEYPSIERESSEISSFVNRTRIEDEELSPFTSWLKGLRGSEYVHPYDDDFGLDQKSGSGVISETFADLLASQGYKDQAIGMYKTLMGKFPEKSRFFAAKIEALK